MGCPNLLDENILQEFLELKSIVGERLAYLIYDKRNSFFRTNEDGLINQEFITRNKSFSSQRDTILSLAIEELENIDSDYIEKIKNSLNETNASDNVKPGVSELFKSNPELANIGTPEQYSQYLDTIFPDYIDNFAYEAVEELLVVNKIIDRKC